MQDDKKSSFQEDSFEWLVPYMTLEKFKKGDVLFKAGDNAAKMYYIKKGTLRLVELDVIVGRDSIIGETGIVSPFRKRTASAVCEEDVEAYTLHDDETIELFYKNPSLALKLVQLSIKRFIENYTKSIAERERIESQLRIAREIQEGALPRVFPPFPERNEIDIFASMEPAKEVGGDFYDFFFLDDNRLYVLIGDVSGKGVPAALFMMICKTLLKSEALNGGSAGEILARANNAIYPDNDTCMFVTVFCAIINTETGEVDYVCAGHNPPLISRDGGEYKFLDLEKSSVLGPMPDARFSSGKLQLNPNDVFFLYTDGVTEALNSDEEFYSEERLKNFLTNMQENDPTKMIGEMKKDIRQFARGALQYDDITMLALRYNGK
jgi:sigma-B regulation protein RsbU (phosphoserine phosphatase)